MTSVVIVDDYQPFRDSARGLLEGGGFEVVGEASGGLEALQLAEELHPDVVLLDVHLPDIDGFEVTRRLAERDPAPAVVLISSRDDYALLAAKTAARAFIRKDDLSAEALRSVLD